MMAVPMSNNRQYAEALVKLASQHVQLAGMKALNELLLRHGVEYTGAPKPKDVRWGRKKLCFMNAFNLATRRPELTYVEGYGCWSFPGMLHAWCVDAEGRVIDPTWRYTTAQAPTVEYLGLPMKTEWVIEETLRNKVYGVLSYGAVLSTPWREWYAGPAWLEVVQ